MKGSQDSQGKDFFDVWKGKAGKKDRQNLFEVFYYFRNGCQEASDVKQSLDFSASIDTVRW